MKLVNKADPKGPVPFSSDAFVVTIHDIDTQTKNLISHHNVLIFSKSTCEFCKEAKKIFARLGVEVETLELDQLENGAALHAAVKSLTGQKTVPAIYIGGNFIGGCSDLKRMEASGELMQIISPTCRSQTGSLLDNIDRPWDEGSVTSPGLFSFPDTLNNNTVRAKGLLTMIIGICGAVFWENESMHWVIVGLLVDFVLSFMFGGTFSLLGSIADMFTRHMIPVWVAGPPKQFAAFCGIIFTTCATALFFAGDHQNTTLNILGAAFCGMLACAAGAEGFFNFCAGCVVFKYMVQFGLVKDTVYKIHIDHVNEVRLLWDEFHTKPATSSDSCNRISRSTASPELSNTSGSDEDKKPLLTPASAAYKIKEEDSWRHDFHMIRNMHMGYFMWPMALSTQAFVFRVATMSPTIEAPSWIWTTLACISAVLYVMMIGLYVAKGIFYFKKVYKEWSCSLRGPIFGVPLFILCLEASFLTEADLTTAKVLLWIGTLGLTMLSFALVSRWIATRHEMEHVSPSWMIVPVYSFINSAILIFVDAAYVEVAVAHFGFAIIVWIPLFVMQFQKLVVTHNSDDRLRNLIFMLAAAPAAASLSWMFISSVNADGNVYALQMDMASKVLFLGSAALLAGLFATVYPHKFAHQVQQLTLCLGINSVSFSVNAVACAGLFYDLTLRTTITKWMAWIGLATGAWLTSVYTLQSITALLDKRIFVPKYKWGPFSSFNRLMHESVRTMASQLITHVTENQNAASSLQFRQLWDLFERLHVLHSTLEDDFLFPLVAQFVPRQSAHAENEHEEHHRAFAHINSLLNDKAVELADTQDSKKPESDANEHQSSSADSVVLSIDEASTAEESKTRLQKSVIDLMTELEEHMREEEKHLQPIGRKYVTLEAQKRVIRQAWESVDPNTWSVLVPVILRYMPYHQQRVRWVRGVLWAMPEEAQKLGLYIYHGVSDVMWVQLKTAVPEIIPRMHDAPEATEWQRYY